MRALSVLSAVFVLVLLLSVPSTAFAESRQQGIALFNEGRELIEKPRSKDDLANGLKKLEEALRIFQLLGEENGAAETFGKMGQVHRSFGQYARAVECYHQALEIRRRTGPPARAAVLLNDMGLVYKAQGEYANALQCYEEALQIDQKTDGGARQGSTLFNIGSVYRSLGQYSKALEYMERSLELMKSLGDITAEGIVLNGIGSVHDALGQYSKAMAFYDRSLAISKQVDDLDTQGTTLNNLGSAYWGWGRYVKALEFYEKALDIFTRLGNAKLQSTALNNIGTVYRLLGCHAEALESYQQSFEISSRTLDRHMQGITLHNMGDAYEHAGEYQEALKHFNEAIDTKTAIGAPTERTKDLVANLYIDMGRLDLAEQLAKESGYTATLGRICLVNGEYSSAQEYYSKLLSWGLKTRHAYDLFTAYTGLGMALEGIGDHTRAADYFAEAARHSEEMRSSLNRPQREAFFDVRMHGFSRLTPYKGLARALLKTNRPLDAFKRSEFTKARVFAEAISKQASGKPQDVPQAVLSRDAELTDQIASVRNRLRAAIETGDQSLIGSLESEARTLESQLDDHIKRLREDYPLFAATRYPEPMDVSQTALRNDEWVLEYDVTDPGLIVYLTRGKELIKALFKAVPRKDLAELVQTFRNPLEPTGTIMTDAQLEAFDFASGKKLADILVADVLSELPKGAPIVVIPDDCLGVLPFEMLVLNDNGIVKTDKDLPYVSGAEFFGDRNFISYSQSVTALTLSRSHAKSNGKGSGLLLIADPVYQENDERVAGSPVKEPPNGFFASIFKRLGLMAAEKDRLVGGLKFSRLSVTGELAQALTRMDTKNATVCAGFEATKSNFLDKIAPGLSQYDKVIFATHGYFGKDLPGIMEPVLVLTLVPPGIDGYLKMTEVTGLNMNADIVVLTACQTGLGKRMAGEGTMGMGRAFQYAGARSVLMSLWSVSELASVRLVTSFFRNLKEGKSKSEALASARSELRKKGFDHPFFWAGFILVGERN